MEQSKLLNFRKIFNSRMAAKPYLASIVKTTLTAIHNLNTDEIETLKAKKRQEGKVWTQPSRRKVTKRGGRIIPTSDLKSEKKEDQPTPKSASTNKATSKPPHKESSSLEKESQENAFKGLKDLVGKVKPGKNNNSTEEYMSGLKEIAKQFTPKQIDTIKKYKKHIVKANQKLDNLWNERHKAQTEYESNNRKHKKIGRISQS